MDDFVLSNLQESKNEWCARLVNIFTPLVIEGIRSIFNEAWNICNQQKEPEKYLMVFQNLLSAIPKWNSFIIEEEVKRIIDRSACTYLEDLITCVHIIQLKIMTCIRVGNKQKKIDISIPKLQDFVHKVYVNVARKVYLNVYLLEKNISPLQTQKNNRELEIIVQECILITIRDSIPTEAIIRAYMEDSLEYEETITIENVDDTELAKIAEKEAAKNDADVETTTDTEAKEKEDTFQTPSIRNLDDKEVVTRLSFNDYDTILGDKEEQVSAPKSIDRLEEISVSNALKRRMENEQEDLDDRIRIHTDDLDVSALDIFDIDSNDTFSSAVNKKDEYVTLDDIEFLE